MAVLSGSMPDDIFLHEVSLISDLDRSFYARFWGKRRVKNTAFLPCFYRVFLVVKNKGDKVIFLLSLG